MHITLFLSPKSSQTPHTFTFFFVHSASMEHHRRNTQTIQIPLQLNGLPLRSLASDDVVLPVSDRQMVPFLLPQSIDLDRSLTNVFSLLNLSPAKFIQQPAFLPETLAGEIGSDGEGFGHPFGSNTRVLNNSRYYTNNHICGFAPNKLQTHKFLSSLCLKELRGRICSLAKDQNGCRILQAIFEKPTVEDVDFVLCEVVDSIADLMKDQIGNYLVQKLIVVCNDEQKMRILVSLTKVPISIILVCMNPHGTRVVQKLLENLKDPNQVKLVTKALHCGATMLANDPNGHHVIQYCLVHFHSGINKPILSEIADKCFKVATDRSGCCVLQACVEHSRGQLRNRLVAQIMADSIHLAEDPFGNYVLQHMLGLNIPEFTALLVTQLQGNFASLSCNKYASNVVEKCLNESGEQVSTRIILELIRSPNSWSLLVDPYANFVIQSALKVSKGFAHECLRCLILKNMSVMQSNLYGKKILERFEKKRIQHG